MHSKSWPNGFEDFLKQKGEVNLEKSATASRLRKKGAFSEANIVQLCFAEKIEDRGAEARRVINNFLNPNWTEDYGSGGNEEGHLLMMRNHYYKTEFVVKSASTKVNAFLRQLKLNPDRASSTYTVNLQSNEEEIANEVQRVARIDGEQFDPAWYPSMWLSFYLFGMPAHGTDSPFLTLTSGKPKGEQTSAQMITALTDLNTEAAAKSLRRKNNSKAVAGEEPNKPVESRKMVIDHNFIRPEVKHTEYDRLREAYELLKGDDINSDEENGFSKRRKKQEIGLKLLDRLLNPNNDDADDK